jgi:hypothetical protein
MVCGRKHFGTLGVDYDVVTSLEDGSKIYAGFEKVASLCNPGESGSRCESLFTQVSR